ncbi:hypothetical protein PR048_011096 [Dryococelus australis]|uniref:Uncharacterized protein n=1 Tax=Dryococelus australis TaxID=614101 RepID=A0ABQ9HKT9_9NEOP|nr:hypothetical protein PR048_011096 [Dryococelus australis]
MKLKMKKVKLMTSKDLKKNSEQIVTVYGGLHEENVREWLHVDMTKEIIESVTGTKKKEKRDDSIDGDDKPPMKITQYEYLHHVECLIVGLQQHIIYFCKLQCFCLSLD